MAKEVTDKASDNVSRMKLICFFGAAVLGLHAALWTFAGKRIMEPYQVWLAGIVAWMIDLTGITAQAQHVYILLPFARWEMSIECTAINAMVVFVAFVLAYPGRFRAKAIGLASGVAILFAVNLLRLLGLAWATRLFPASAEFMHDYVWQVAFLFLVLVLWFAWLDLVVRREN